MKGDVAEDCRVRGDDVCGQGMETEGIAGWCARGVELFDVDGDLAIGDSDDLYSLIDVIADGEVAVEFLVLEEEGEAFLT